MRFLHKIVVLFAIILIAASCELFNSAYDPIVITGKITNSSGDPVSGVKVYARSYLSNDSVVSSSDGKYRLKLSRAGVFRVEFKKETYTTKTFDKVIRGGEWLKLDVTMTMLSEDAFLEIPEHNYTILNTKNNFFVIINRNIAISAIPTVDWLSVDYLPTGIRIQHEENENNMPRSGLVIIEGEYGLKDTINITQQAGPVLKVIDFLGKDNLTKFPEDVPSLKQMYFDWLGAVLTTIDRKSIRYLDFNPGTNKIIYIREGINNAVLLVGEGTAPVVLCENASLVEVMNAKQILFNPQRNYTIAGVSGDHSMVALRCNDKLYLFRSEMFTEYFSKFNSL